MRHPVQLDSYCNRFLQDSHRLLCFSPTHMHDAQRVEASGMFPREKRRVRGLGEGLLIGVHRGVRKVLRPVFPRVERWVRGS